MFAPLDKPEDIFNRLTIGSVPVPVRYSAGYAMREGPILGYAHSAPSAAG